MNFETHGASYLTNLSAHKIHPSDFTQSLKIDFYICYTFCSRFGSKSWTNHFVMVNGPRIVWFEIFGCIYFSRQRSLLAMFP